MGSVGSFIAKTMARGNDLQVLHIFAWRGFGLETFACAKPNALPLPCRFINKKVLHVSAQGGAGMFRPSKL